MAAPEIISELVERFEKNLKTYKSSEYTIDNLRLEFVKPFIKEFGWDVYNEFGYKKDYRDVISENYNQKNSKIGTPDYSFRVMGETKFYLKMVEPFSYSPEQQTDITLQLRRYGWSAKLNFSLLFSFEWLVVCDCRLKSPFESGNTNFLQIYHFTDFLKKWDELCNLLSKKSILENFQGVFSLKPDFSSPNVEFSLAKDMGMWRKTLAECVLQNNPNVLEDELNLSLQILINKLIFLRICEDKGLEKYGTLKSVLDFPDSYQKLLDLLIINPLPSLEFYARVLNEVELGFADSVQNLKVSDSVINEIISSLYFPLSPYEFSVIDLDVLCRIQEEYLRKYIYIDEKKQIVEKCKPEANVFPKICSPTPYIVEYIIHNTSGKRLQGKKPDDFGGHDAKSSFRLLDPACSTGIFLIYSYQYLADWYLRWYAENSPEDWSNREVPLLQNINQDWELTLAKKIWILNDHIYGVDKDVLAIEVSKFLLLLKVLEKETSESIRNYLQINAKEGERDFHIVKNIKCGHSLIGPEFLDQESIKDVSLSQFKALNWEKEFPEVFAEKANNTTSEEGFDVIVCNPPFYSMSWIKKWYPKEISIYKKNYITVGEGSTEIYAAFIERGLQLLNESGQLGFVLPHRYCMSKKGTPVREWISREKHLSQIVHFGNQLIFEGVKIYSSLLFLSKQAVGEAYMVKVESLSEWINHGKVIEFRVNNKNITSSRWDFFEKK
ncbi:MAG: Eco57I restriction-modification methylase domain-containing protein [Leptospiraceae bacterium]|nr:Eco57I restriction-modification methylase domain-containing protein [Leptospiraceae bacterium]MCP5496575.1 Eco57I restriction-modification methylase domain-containing protein [Leptospiraceae bacterium]